MVSEDLDKLFHELLEQWHCAELSLAREFETLTTNFDEEIEEDYLEYKNRYEEIKKRAIPSLWEVIPDEENSDYDMYSCAIVKADTKEEAESIATNLNKFDGESTKQIWKAREIDLENMPNGIIYADYMQG